MIRLLDIIFSLLGLIFLSPIFVIMAVIIMIESRGGAFYFQLRVGKNGKEFNLIKFRTMKKDSDKYGLLTVGGKDKRITRSGFFLRKLKLDELPQLMNVLLGEMSIVGPRPEVRKYVELYTSVQREILKIKPGITDLASITYSDENNLLGKSKDPEKTYIEEIMPAKIKLSMEYANNQCVYSYFRLILTTIISILK